MERERGRSFLVGLHSFIHSFDPFGECIHSCVHSIIHPSIHSFIHPSIYLLIRPSIHSSIDPFILLFPTPTKGKLSDFGISKRIAIGQSQSISSSSDDEDDDDGVSPGAQKASIPLLSVPAGTPLFMAPEVLLNHKQKIGPKSDIWSLGVTALQLWLAGEMPFPKHAMTNLRRLAYWVVHQPSPEAGCESRAVRSISAWEGKAKWILYFLIDFFIYFPCVCDFSSSDDASLQFEAFIAKVNPDNAFPIMLIFV